MFGKMHTKMRFARYVIAALTILAAAGCRDDFMTEEISGEGKASVSVTLDFKPMSSALSRTRAAGDALKEINSLHVLLYDFDTKELKSRWAIGKYDLSEEERGNEDAENGVSAEGKTARAAFRLPDRIEFGKYYMYAVANIPDLFTNAAYSEAVKTVDGLKEIPLAWNSGEIAANGQMIGCLTNAPTLSEEDLPLILNENSTSIHAWLRRAASKVTVAFDGSSLKEGVSIYLKELRIKNIPRSCKLGAKNTVESDENLISGGTVTYRQSESYDASYPALITKEQPFYPRVQKDGGEWVMDPNRHSETNPNTLFFYENMQGKGPDKRQKDENNGGEGDGILDELYPYQDKPYATYIEVDAYYESADPDRPGICNITYRFMLGQDIITDYDAKRNCHYKLTLHFNGYADDPDWRIDYVTRLWATQPETVDYRGKYFVPDYEIQNLGDDFRSDNAITVTSFMYRNDAWAVRDPVDYKIEYRDAGSTEFSETPPSWIGKLEPVHEGNGVYKLKINYKNPYDEVTLDKAFKPEKTGIYDLSTKGGTTNMNTANCYVVDSKGTYQFPLVYGNAITDGVQNSDSYTYKGWGNIYFHDELYLRAFPNYRNVAIKSAYILEDLDHPAGLSASLVWQDEPGLVADITYVPGGNGAIQFTVGDKIKEGNAVIALKDQAGAIIWSWHIWVTAIDLSRTLTLTNHATYGSRKYEIMPVNIGWCSGGAPVRYYDRHECEVRFTQLIGAGGEQGLSKTVKIIQEPHIAVPCGNNPYFQHGRKDPFVAGGGTDKSTKTWYDAGGVPHTEAPAKMHAESVADDKRTATYRSTAALIQNPDKWQNGPRVETGLTGEGAQKYYPTDTVYFNLWDNSTWDDNDDVVKTIYDPCPAGYHVSSIYTFTGFTNTGDGTTGAENLFAATEGNMLPEYRTDLYEFYTDRTKLISIGFPQNGYRDWDDNAETHRMDEGDVWHAQAVPFDWGNNPKGYAQIYLAYSLQFVRSQNAVRPQNNYYATDGFAIRATKTLP